MLTDAADLTRSARQALWQLTYARPHLVVLNLSLMLRRLGANAVSAMVTAAAVGAESQNQGGGASTPPTLRVVMSSPALAAPLFTNTGPPANSLHPQAPVSPGSTASGCKFFCPPHPTH